MLVSAVLASFSLSTAELRGAHRGHGFLAVDMQPDVVAHTLLNVEGQWRTQAAQTARNNASASAAFQKSCATVIDAIVQGSNGDKKRVNEYMNIVCSRSELQGWHQQRCEDLATAVESAMVFDQGGNREHVNVSHVCTGFWSRFVVEEREVAAKERSEQEQRAKETEAQRIVVEQEETKRIADEQDRKEKEETKQRSEDAKRQAEEAAAQLAAKKAETEQQAAEAKLQLEKAQKVAEEAAQRHMEAVEKALAAANATKNVTVHVNVTSNVTTSVNSTPSNSTLANSTPSMKTNTVSNKTA